MPSFDIVSEISGHEIRNAVENANRELTNRWDFRNVQAAIEFNEKNESIKVSSESDFQVEQLIDILRNACIKRNIESTSLDIPADYEHSGKTYSKEIKLKQGIETDMAKKLTKLIKDLWTSYIAMSLRISKIIILSRITISRLITKSACN